MDGLLPSAFDLEQYLAFHPELSGEEFQSSARMADFCRREGMETEYPFAGLPTAFRAAAVRTSHPKGKLCILCEYDALPIGHGCGHCAHGTMSALAAAALRRMADQCSMDVDIIGTPDEELRGAKIDMCRAGIFKEYDFAMMIHSASHASTACSVLLALDMFRVSFKGKPAHAAAAPWEGRNALNGVMLSLHALDMLRQHVLPDTRMGWYIVHGGTASNIIPESAEFELTTRHSTRAYLDRLNERIARILQGAAMATETECDIRSFCLPFDEMNRNLHAVSVVEDVMSSLGISLTDPDPVKAASSDVGNVSFQCPAVQAELALSDHDFPLHTEEMVRTVQNPRIIRPLALGARVIAFTLLRLMKNPDLLDGIRREFESGKLRAADPVC
jgi:amidohydrolase